MTPISFPSTETLNPWLMKLRKNVGSVVIIAIELPSPHADPLIKWGWLSKEERESVRKSLTKINRRRSAAGEPKTDQIPK